MTRRPVSLEAAGKLTWHHGAWGLRCDWGAAWGSPKQLASNRPVVERPEDMLTSGHMLLALGKMDLSANFLWAKLVALAFAPTMQYLTFRGIACCTLGVVARVGSL